MNKPKHSEVKKTLVRNPEQPAPKTITVKKSNISTHHSANELSSNTREKTQDSGFSKEKVVVKTRFNTPELHSTLKLSKKIDEVVKPRKTKSLSDVDKNRLAVDEKVTRKVNFPYGQPVFKDLIPLSNNEVKSQPSLVSRGPILPKDKEPVLSDFLEPRKPKIYYHLPNCGTKTFEERGIFISATDSLRLYKILQINKETV